MSIASELMREPEANDCQSNALAGSLPESLQRFIEHQHYMIYKRQLGVDTACRVIWKITSDHLLVQNIVICMCSGLSIRFSPFVLWFPMVVKLIERLSRRVPKCSIPSLPNNGDRRLFVVVIQLITTPVLLSLLQFCPYL